MRSKICPFKHGNGLERLCPESACALWVESHEMCAIKLQAETAARAATTAERQVREARRTVRGKKE